MTKAQRQKRVIVPLGAVSKGTLQPLIPLITYRLWQLLAIHSICNTNTMQLFFVAPNFSYDWSTRWSKIIKFKF